MEKVKRFVDAHVIYCQSYLLEQLLAKGLITNEYPFTTENEIMEWWLVTPWLARKLQESGEVTIEEFGCYWWGRQTSGQAIYLDQIMSDICSFTDLI